MHLRKAHYMSGWDWGACLPDGGIFRPVTLLGIESARLDSVYIRQVHEDGKVLLIPEVDVETVDRAEIDTDEKTAQRCLIRAWKVKQMRIYWNMKLQ